MKALTFSLLLAAETLVCLFLASGAANFSALVLLSRLQMSSPLRGRRVTCAGENSLPVRKVSETSASPLFLASGRRPEQ